MPPLSNEEPGSRSTILDTIVAHKRKELARRRRADELAAVRSEAAAAPPPRDFAAALQAPGVSLIAEIKRASPSAGSLRLDLDPVALARIYAEHGAAAISVLTDARFFAGSLDDLRAVRAAVAVPTLRKDFILDPYQVYEARAAGADAVLLIVAALSDARLRELHALVNRLGMAALVEVHNRTELKRALEITPRVIGINNRDLRTFEVSLDTTEALGQLVPEKVVTVAESGIKTEADVERLRRIGVDAILVGTSLVKATDTAAAVRRLVRAGREPERAGESSP
ncbi:MAG: indole-3-glycerol phosphate synthase TrpC [Anaerolineae bacterium]